MKVEVEHKEDIAILTAAMLRESLVLCIDIYINKEQINWRQ